MPSNNSLERVIALLDLFSEARLEWTPDRMMAELGYSRPTLYRYLKTLKDAGFLTTVPSGAYTLGPRVVEMDFLMRQSDALVFHARPHLERLAETWPSTALLVRWYENKLLCVASENTAPDLQTNYPRGRPMPLARGAISRAIIAFLPRRKMLQLVDANIDELVATGLGRTREAVLEALRQVRRTGYATAHGEVTPGIMGTAAPVFDGGSSPIAALGLTVTETVGAGAGPEKIGRRLAEAAADISELLSRESGTDAGIATRPRYQVVDTSDLLRRLP